jgi:probable HAF family extracellular repeat protein
VTRRLAIIAAFALLAAAPARSRAAPRAIYDLGTLGGAQSYAVAINDAGLLVGWSQTGSGGWHAFLYDGVMYDLGTLGGSASEAWDINSAGQIVGYATTAGDAAARAFLYADEVMQALPTLGGTHGYAAGINTAGQIVGWSSTAGDGAVHAFLYADGQIRDLGTLGGTDSWAQAINDAGQVVGMSYTAGNAAIHAFLYDPSISDEMLDLGTLGGVQSGGWSINIAGQIAGFVQPAGDAASQAALYDPGDGAWQILGAPGGSSEAYGINDAGWLVGGFRSSGDAWRAFHYADGALHELGTLGGLNSEAYGLNAQGWIVGWSETADEGAVRPFLAVPLPATLVWSGADGGWDAPEWYVGRHRVIPAGGEDLVIAAGHVHLEGTLAGPLAPASLSLEGGSLSISAGSALEILGPLHVARGATLDVDGDVAAAAVVIEGMLAGSGRIEAPTVVISGVLSPGAVSSGGGAAATGSPASLSLGAALGGGAAHASWDPAEPDSATVPEPSVAALLALAAAGLLVRARRG